MDLWGNVLYIEEGQHNLFYRLSGFAPKVGFALKVPDLHRKPRAVGPGRSCITDRFLPLESVDDPPAPFRARRRDARARVASGDPEDFFAGLTFSRNTGYGLR